ncbi:hypothetical protein ACEPAF_3009 [Sanghuangporus sanghuang]
MTFSRGNVTITDASTFTPPQVIVDWLNVDFGLDLQTSEIRASRKILDDAAFRDISAGETSPGTETNPNGVSHPVGTTAMMRRDLGGAVDGKLSVCDTLNLRVVDSSILPNEISAHMQSSLYGVVEKAADIIKSGA